ncbi:MAG: hypothetical protein RMK45_06905, partial [Armatimonadota bacterium]|nr:hypothetical protein [Armatimonadota bacterium]
MRNWLKGILAATIALSATTLWAQLVASDDADDAVYNDGWQLTDNGGFGLNPWYEISAGGGGRFIATAPFQVLAGNRSWGLFAGNGNYAIGRPLQTPRDSGVFSVLARHNVNNEVGFTGIAVYSGASEVIRFGLNPSSGNQAVFYQFGANTGSIDFFGTELRGARLRYALTWDSSGNFTLVVANLGGPQVGVAFGNWGSGVSVSAFGFLNFNSGSFQDLIFDKIEVVPEPASMLALGAGLAGLLA